MRRFLPVVPVVALLCGLGGVACDDHTATDPSLADVLFQVSGGDEALSALLAATPQLKAPQAPIVDNPQPGVTLPATPTTLTWHDGDVAQARPPRPGPQRPAFDLPDWLVAPALAHGPSLNGRAYLLVIASDKDPKLVRVFTQASSWLPAANTWQKLQAAGGKLTLTVTSAVFEGNAVTQGPFASQAVTFQVAP